MALKNGLVTLRDIADKTGYTVNTVSHALKDLPDISEATKAKIRQVAGELGYVRNSLAESLRSGRTKTIAVILGGMSNPFYAMMSDQLQREASKYGYSLFFLCSRENPEIELQAAHTAISHQADGVILFPGKDYAQTEAFLRDSGKPCQLISRYLSESPFDTLVLDEEMGGYLATQHLFNAGRKKIAMHSRRYTSFATEKRTAGFIRACLENGIENPERYIAAHAEDGEIARQLTEWISDGVDGIFCFCDVEAWTIISLLQDMGLSVPEDLSIVGFDNIQGSYRFPIPLCTIGFDLEKMISEAVHLLIQRIDGENIPRQSLVYPVSLVCRESCRPRSK